MTSNVRRALVTGCSVSEAYSNATATLLPKNKPVKTSNKKTNSRKQPHQQEQQKENNQNKIIGSDRLTHKPNLLTALLTSTHTTNTAAYKHTSIQTHQHTNTPAYKHAKAYQKNSKLWLSPVVMLTLPACVLNARWMEGQAACASSLKNTMIQAVSIIARLLHFAVSYFFLHFTSLHFTSLHFTSLVVLP